MKGFKQPKKLTADQANKKADQAHQKAERLELTVAMLRLELRQRTAAFLVRAEMFERMFQTVLKTAGTITEASRWYDQWIDDIDQIPLDHPDHEAEVQKVLDRHGFEFTFSDNHAEVDKMWEASRA